MKIITKSEFQDMINSHPNGGIVFSEYASDALQGEIMVTDGNFGATCIVPFHGEVFDFDWSINEYSADDQFVIFDSIDNLQMIQNLTKCLDLGKDLTWNGPVD